MISQCPVCSRSYPSHHGSVCKMCAAKNAVTTTDKGPVKTVTKANIPTPANSASSSFAAKSLFSTTETKANVPEEDKKRKNCPHCDYPNEPDDVFCYSCKKMIKTTGFKAKTDYPLTDLKNVQTLHLQKLKEIGINNTEKLLEAGSNSVKRQTLMLKTKISEMFIMRMLNQADLLRIPDLEPEHAYLLEIIGIGSLRDLEKKKTAEVHSLILKNKVTLNSKQIILLPDEKLINKWFENLKNLSKVLS